ncbi:DUF481 domain-containing protein [Acidithiobacillus thiooxidans]|uniref:Uncharacterized protein n=1 Tax=Acidithiobacillus thiooxidans ATCC 19377 TaxID=637390 RepID=A0A543Q009_ACITH|nr:DUF481 domain-containing protein [Acidithiobacillus thiooxidans]MDX5936341.1 DUF481 domain-containing protein [Acidithiobacillus thiooxidans]TQN49658.1 hypothetical protein DLNHIDIE_03067 [Acidithiobacillus thiooxidans ATCC 19377]
MAVDQAPNFLIVQKNYLIKKPDWSGSMDLGLSSSTGTSRALNLNTDDELLWYFALWSNQSTLLSNYATFRGEVSADRLDASNETRYDIALQQYLFANLNYHSNNFDGWASRKTSPFQLYMIKYNHLKEMGYDR